MRRLERNFLILINCLHVCDLPAGWRLQGSPGGGHNYSANDCSIDSDRPKAPHRPSSLPNRPGSHNYADRLGNVAYRLARANIPRLDTA